MSVGGYYAYKYSTQASADSSAQYSKKFATQASAADDFARDSSGDVGAQDDSFDFGGGALEQDGGGAKEGEGEVELVGLAQA